MILSVWHGNVKSISLCFLRDNEVNLITFTMNLISGMSLVITRTLKWEQNSSTCSDSSNILLRLKPVTSGRELCRLYRRWDGELGHRKSMGSVYHAWFSKSTLRHFRPRLRRRRITLLMLVLSLTTYMIQYSSHFGYFVKASGFLKKGTRQYTSVLRQYQNLSFIAINDFDAT